jgi:hypothetical protein
MRALVKLKHFAVESDWLWLSVSDVSSWLSVSDVSSDGPLS